MGKVPSGGNLKRLSSTQTIPWPPRFPTLGDDDLPLLRDEAIGVCAGGEGAAAAGGDTGGGGGGADGATETGRGGGAVSRCPMAFRAACTAIEGVEAFPFAGCDGGGGGGVDRAGAAGGGGGGAPRVEVGGGGGGAGVEGFLGDTGGGAAFDPGNGGGARGGGESGVGFEDKVDTVDDGLDAGRGGGLRRLATSGLGAGAESVDGGGGGGRAIGGLGAAGGLGADGTGPSLSERYVESRLAPVSTPPRLRSLGIPPANSPPSCAAGALGALSTPEPVSLPLRALLGAAPEGTGGGGAMPVGGLPKVGTGGAPATGGAPPTLPPVPPNCGAERSFVTAFFNLVPLLISERSAP